MEGVEVDGESISPEEFESDAGWLSSHRQRNSRAVSKLRLTPEQARDSRRSSTPLGRSTKRTRNSQPPRAPQLPKEHIKIILRPRDGLDVRKLSDAHIRDAVFTAANIVPREAEEDILRTNPTKNIVLISTPTMANAEKYNSIRKLRVDDTIYETTAYAAPPEDTVKGVIHHIPSYDTADDITRSLVYKKNPTILQARRMGKTNSVVIIFEGKRVPYFVYYRGAEYRCLLHKKKHEVCDLCGRLGHRSDVCPAPEDKVCKGCGARNPGEDHACDPKCALCGKDHATGDKTCRQRFRTPFLLKQRQWEKENRLQHQQSQQKRDQHQRPSSLHQEDDGNLKSPTGILRNTENYNGSKQGHLENSDEGGKRSRSSSFPRLPSLSDGPHVTATGGQHRSRSKSPGGGQRRASRSGSRSSRVSETNADTSPTAVFRGQVSGNTVSWAETVSHSKAPLGVKSDRQGPARGQDKNDQLEQELTRIRQMMEHVTRENIALKKEIARLKDGLGNKAGQKTEIEQARASEVQTQVEMDTTNETERMAPPPHKKKREQNEKPQASPSEESTFEQLESRIENKIDHTLEEFGKKIENMFSTFAQDITNKIAGLNARITAIEMGSTNPPPQVTASVGPIKGVKPYARPTSVDSPKINRSDTPNWNGSE